MKAIFFSPHFDDLPLTIGGLVPKLKNVEEVNIFTRTNYLNGDEKGNRDLSEKRVQYVTGIRLIENLNCLDYLNIRKLTLLGKNESLLRGYKIGKYKFEFVVSSEVEKKENKTINEIKKELKDFLVNPIDAYFPLAIRKHVDHLVLREAVIRAVTELKAKLKANVFFGEDQPYAGTASENDWKEVFEFIKKHKLKAITYPIDLKEKLRLLRFYPSQTDKSYFEGVKKRALDLQKEMKSKSPMERIYRYSVFKK